MLAPPPTDDAKSIIAANIPTGDSDMDPEVVSAFSQEVAERQLTNLSRALIDQDLNVERGVALPFTFTPPNDEGFILVATDGGEDQRDSAGRRRIRSTVRIAKEAWLRIAQTNRVRLFPSPAIRVTDPLWVDGPIVRPWMSATCVPFFYDLISTRTRERPRALRLAIPSHEPGRSLAIEFLQRVYGDERRSRAACKVNQPKFLTPAEAAIVLRMWEQIAGSAGIRPKRAIKFGLAPNASAEMISQQIVHASEASPDEMAIGLFTQEQKKDARTIMNNVGLNAGFSVISNARAQLFNENDPVAVDQLPESEEMLQQRTERIESAFQRLLLGRFLMRNPRTNVGPKIGDTTQAEREEGARQAAKIMSYDPATNVLTIQKDARWRLNLKKKTLNLVEDEDGNFDRDASNISDNLIAWIDFLWGDQIRAFPERFAIELEGLMPLAQKLFYGRI
jgi:hypothetical protein